MPDTVSQDLAPDLSSVLSVMGIALMTNFGNLGQNFGPQNGSEMLTIKPMVKQERTGEPEAEAGVPRGASCRGRSWKVPTFYGEVHSCQHQNDCPSLA